MICPIRDRGDYAVSILRSPGWRAPETKEEEVAVRESTNLAKLSATPQGVPYRDNSWNKNVKLIRIETGAG